MTLRLHDYDDGDTAYQVVEMLLRLDRDNPGPPWRLLASESRSVSGTGFRNDETCEARAENTCDRGQTAGGWIAAQMYSKKDGQLENVCISFQVSFDFFRFAT